MMARVRISRAERLRPLLNMQEGQIPVYCLGKWSRVSCALPSPTLDAPGLQKQTLEVDPDGRRHIPVWNANVCSSMLKVEGKTGSKLLPRARALLCSSHNRLHIAAAISMVTRSRTPKGRLSPLLKEESSTSLRSEGSEWHAGS